MIDSNSLIFLNCDTEDLSFNRMKEGDYITNIRTVRVRLTMSDVREYPQHSAWKIIKVINQSTVTRTNDSILLEMVSDPTVK